MSGKVQSMGVDAGHPDTSDVRVTKEHRMETHTPLAASVLFGMVLVGTIFLTAGKASQEWFGKDDSHFGLEEVCTSSNCLDLSDVCHEDAFLATRQQVPGFCTNTDLARQSSWNVLGGAYIALIISGFNVFLAMRKPGLRPLLRQVIVSGAVGGQASQAFVAVSTMFAANEDLDADYDPKAGIVLWLLGGVFFSIAAVIVTILWIGCGRVRCGRGSCCYGCKTPPEAYGGDY